MKAENSYYYPIKRMLSDEIGEFIEKIRQYQKEAPETYDELAIPIEIVISGLRTLSASLVCTNMKLIRKPNDLPSWTEEDLKNWHKFLGIKE